MTMGKNQDIVASGPGFEGTSRRVLPEVGIVPESCNSCRVDTKYISGALNYPGL